MNPWHNWEVIYKRALAMAVAAALLANVPALSAQSDLPSQPVVTSRNASQPKAQHEQTLPDTPSAALAQAKQTDPPAPSPSAQEAPQPTTATQKAPGTTSPVQQNSPQAQNQNGTSNGASQPNAQNQQLPAQTHEPLGTAAAEAIPTTGIAASRPAGAALAPAKQHRVRSILIKVGAIAGAGAAVGIAFALSKSSPSTPPGSR